MVENIVEFLRQQVSRFDPMAYGDNEDSLRDELAHIMQKQGRCEPRGTQIPAGCVVSIDRPI